MLDVCAEQPGQLLSEDKQQRCAQHEPRENPQEGVSGSAQKKERADQTAEDARRHERDHYASRNVQPLSIRTTAGRYAEPESNGLGGIGWDRRNAGEQQRGKG